MSSPRFIIALLVACGAIFLAGYLWGGAAGFVVTVGLIAGEVLGRLAFVDKGARDKALSSSQQEEEKRNETDVDGPTTALLNAAMNDMREGVLVLDEELRVLAANRAAREIFSRDERTLERVRLSELTRNPAVHAAFRSALAEAQRAEIKIELQGAERRAFDLRVAPLRREVGAEPHGAIGVFFDITQLEKLERVRQEFLSNVSHDLRTPLTSIIAFVETLEETLTDDPESSRRFLGIIRRNARRMQDLIEDILELSSIEAGTVELKKEQVRLGPLVEDVTTALAAKAAARGVTLRSEVETDAFVFADARRLEQMLTNLIDNAIKFNRADGSVTIKHARTLRDRISVTDTGDGINGEHIERIFERFYRIDRARTSESGGTGLGLSIVKHLARIQSGEIRVESTPGKGSTFIIELPTSELPVIV
ncbi:MAG: ATP-binding protein [Pyrinomonadaceae bacterium]